jgi:Fe2+ transport system protein FeoA
LFSGPLQIEVCGSRLVLGRGLASKITVELK